MSKFYESISTNYDHIFPTRPPQISFVASRISNGGRIFDVGCATGGLAIALSKQGFCVSGVDLDKTMIDLAIAKAAADDVDVLFRGADMTKLDTGQLFDGIVCLGNTLVHLDEDQALDFLSWTRRSLNPGGRFICQILNYTRIEKENVEALPIIENDAIHFDRSYKRGNSGELLFHTVLTIKSNGERLENEIQLHPIGYEKLGELLGKAGFNQVEYFGDLKGSPFDPASSFPLVFVASCQD